jgi:hypothetical protein
MGLMLSSLLAISVSGQKLTTIQKLILQDDKSADHFVIVIPTGEYKFQSCEGNISTGGIGKVNVSGCKVDLQDISETRRVVAEIDLCSGVGKADIAFEGDGLSGRNDPATFEFVLSDSNTRDSAFDCVPKPIDPK